MITSKKCLDFSCLIDNKCYFSKGDATICHWRDNMPETEFFQTENAKETIAIIRDPNGSISIGIARAGRTDTENGRVTPEGGMNVAEGRARKAKLFRIPLIEKNYLRGIHAFRIERLTSKAEIA